METLIERQKEVFQFELPISNGLPIAQLQNLSVDIGCGDNKINQYFLGVDKRNTSGVDINSPADDLSEFADRSVKIVFTRRVIQHVENDVTAFSEINRILTNDGIAVIEVASAFNANLSKILNALKIKTYPYTTFYAYSKSSLEKKIKKGGLKIISFGYSPTKRWFCKNHLVICVKGDIGKNIIWH